MKTQALNSNDSSLEQQQRLRLFTSMTQALSSNEDSSLEQQRLKP
jgi:hypothetical protein